MSKSNVKGSTDAKCLKYLQTCAFLFNSKLYYIPVYPVNFRSISIYSISNDMSLCNMSY